MLHEVANALPSYLEYSSLQLQSSLQSFLSLHLGSLGHGLHSDIVCHYLGVASGWAVIQNSRSVCCSQSHQSRTPGEKGCWWYTGGWLGFHWGEVLWPEVLCSLMELWKGNKSVSGWSYWMRVNGSKLWLTQCRTFGVEVGLSYIIC